ncbi:MAG: hypothetical protein NTY33_04330 [Candidatus Moranbacteria bacterium]|nr:hypothetical protein [Candidatus Moranbacteria bacterium]
MDDFCDCSSCPHHCGGDDEIDTPADDKLGTTTPNSDESGEASDDEDAAKVSAVESADAKAMADKKVDHLKKDIIELGFKLEDTEDGIRVMM